MKYETLYALVKSSKFFLLDTSKYPETILVPAVGFATANGNFEPFIDMNDEDWFDAALAQMLADGEKHILFQNDGIEAISMTPVFYSTNKATVAGYALGARNGWYYDASKQLVKVMQ